MIVSKNKLCSAPHNDGTSSIRRRIREQHESDSEDEADVVDGLPADHYDRFCRTSVGDFYKKPVRCAAHVVGIADPVRMREQHESDSEDEEDDIEDVARQYFIYSISPCRTTSLILYVIYRAVDFCTRDP